MAFRRTFALLPVAIVLLASIGFVVPWQTCGLCAGAGAKEPKYAGRWTCPTCRDEERLSLWTVLARRRPAPTVERLAQATLPGPNRSDYLRRLDELLDHAGAERREESGFPAHHCRFLSTASGGRLVLAMINPYFSRDTDSLRFPSARFLLFDFDGALLDRIEVAENQARAGLALTVPEDGRADGLLFTVAATSSRPLPDLRVRRDRSREKLALEDVGGGGSKVGIGLENDRFVAR